MRTDVNMERLTESRHRPGDNGKTENGGISHIGMTKPPTEAPFFLFGGLIQPILYKERANELQVSSQIHRLCVCASGSLMIVTFNC